MISSEMVNVCQYLGTKWSAVVWVLRETAEKYLGSGNWEGWRDSSGEYIGIMVITSVMDDNLGCTYVSHKELVPKGKAQCGAWIMNFCEDIEEELIFHSWSGVRVCELSKSVNLCKYYWIVFWARSWKHFGNNQIIPIRQFFLLFMSFV